MKDLPHYFAIMVMLSVGLTGCRNDEINKPGVNDEIAAISKTIHNCIGWAQNKDIDLLYSVIADDPAFLEVHPNDRVVKGIDEFRKAESFWMSPDFKAIRYEISNLAITLSESATVAWWFCMLDDINEYKGQPASWENARWTGVMEKRQGKWVIVQQHFSFAQED